MIQVGHPDGCIKNRLVAATADVLFVPITCRETCALKKFIIMMLTWMLFSSIGILPSLIVPGTWIIDCLF